MKWVLIFLFITSLLIISIPFKILAVEYPIIAIGLNGGWGQSELASGALGRAFLRYSLEAYIPGFQVEVGFAGSFYSALDDSMIFNPDPVVEKRTITTHVHDWHPGLSATFHLRPFGESAIIYFGGGAQIHFLSSDRKTTDRYWDEEAETYQETEIDQTTLLDQTKFGYHCLGGLRLSLGSFGTADLEVRKTFVNVSADDWDNKEASKLWSGKSWNNLSVNLGLTVYIF